MVWLAFPASTSGSPPGRKPHTSTYKGKQGYMLIIGHLAEAGVVIHEEFREGNIAPASGNLEFIKDCCACMPKGHTIAHIRLDSAGYQADIFNYCEDTGKTFAVGGRLDASTQKTIDAIPDDAWKQYADCALAETLHSMNNTDKAFRLVVVKYLRRPNCSTTSPVTTSLPATAATLVWYRSRGEVFENGIKELKIGAG